MSHFASHFAHYPHPRLPIAPLVPALWGGSAVAATVYEFGHWLAMW